jgi:hypothetical protein
MWLCGLGTAGHLRNNRSDFRRAIFEAPVKAAGIKGE